MGTLKIGLGSRELAQSCVYGRKEILDGPDGLACWWHDLRQTPEIFFLNVSRVESPS